jgi:hypothetical protein
MFEIIVGDGKPLQNASVPIRWCTCVDPVKDVQDPYFMKDKVVRAASIKAIPFFKRKPILVLHAIKNKICRPMARR